jgi:hypothetical protein
MTTLWVAACGLLVLGSSFSGEQMFPAHSIAADW